MPALAPTITLEQVHGPGHLFSPRPHPGTGYWLAHDDELTMDRMTGGQLSILGGMPILCSAAASTSDIIGLLAEAGLPTPGPDLLIRYASTAEYGRRLVQAARSGLRIVNTHWHPPGALPPESYANGQALVAFLNNKANLARLVPPAFRPRRSLCAPARVGAPPPVPLPVVVKAATEEPTGGGNDVMICRRARDLPKAARYFARCRRVVLERVITMRRSYCVNFAVLADGRVLCLGAAEQICSGRGLYLGNWLDQTLPLPPEAVSACLTVARRASALGYRGLLGMDVAVCPDGSILVFDLNFRVNGCTAAILLDDAARRLHGHRTAKLTVWRGADRYAALAAAARRAMAKGLILPISAFDPSAIGAPEAHPHVRGLVLGDSRRDVRRREVELAGMGLR